MACDAGGIDATPAVDAVLLRSMFEPQARSGSYFALSVLRSLSSRQMIVADKESRLVAWSEACMFSGEIAP